jgi:heptaprenyl diphosphate synthase component 2
LIALTTTGLIFGLVRPELEEVDAQLALTAQAEHPLLGPMLSMVLPGAGKRLRPTLALLACKLGQADPTAAIHMAVGVELLHTASLVHDDVVDSSELRRGEATLSIKIGNALAVLVGDYLFAQSANRCVATENQPVISLFAQTLANMCQGQIEEASRGNNPHLKLTRDDYYQTIWGKTASLFVLACEGGALLAGLAPAEVEAVRTFGKQLGLAFQLVDDILDFAGDEHELGKPVGSDLRQGTITLPVVYLREELRDGHFARLFAESPPEEIVAEVLASGALDRCRIEAAGLVSEAQLALRALPATPARQALSDLAAFVVERNR